MRMCEQCGDELVRRPKEAFHQFESRRYCSKRCKGIAEHPRKSNEEFRARYRQVTTPDGRKLLEHRYVMELAIGRALLPVEQVHHRNRDRLDNRIENLELVTSAEHGLRHTTHPISKTCAICGVNFTPHKTKRSRVQTCSPACRSALLSIRYSERKK